METMDRRDSCTVSGLFWWSLSLYIYTPPNTLTQITSTNSKQKLAEETLASLHTEKDRVQNVVNELKSQVSQLEQLVLVEKTKLRYAILSMAETDARINDIQSGVSYHRVDVDDRIYS